MKKMFCAFLSISFLLSPLAFAQQGDDSYDGYNQPRKNNNTQDQRMRDGRYCPHCPSGQEQQARTQEQGHYCPHCKDDGNQKQRNTQDGYYKSY